MSYTILWIMWILAFLVIEGAAIFNKDPGDTLSEHVWKWFSVTDKGIGWRIKRVILLAFMGWLTVHFMTGGWM
jgi:hypothetical protein